MRTSRPRRRVRATKNATGLRPAPRIGRVPSAVWYVTGLVLVIAAAGVALSGLVELIDGGTAIVPLFGSAAVIGVTGAALWRITRLPDRLVPSTIFSAVFASWAALSLAGMLPYLWAGVFEAWDFALFESISGFTTTGATVLRPIEGVSRGILFWRSLTQWIGGVGVIVFAMSVLPYLGVGGMDLMAAEAPGPTSERLAPRVQETAKRLVLLYLAFSLVVALLYGAFGMDVYDAVVHTFTTVSTGGFSPYNLSFARFDSAALEWIAVAAMIFAGGSFALYWRAIRGKPVVILRSKEFQGYVAIMVLITGSAVAWNVADVGWGHEVVRRTIFSTISLSSSTGYTILDYDQWAGAVKLLLIFAMALGGMSGSTTGGFKVFRLLSVLAFARRQWFRQLHPRSVDVVRLGREVLPERVVARVVGFFGLFMAIGGLATFLVAALASTDPVTAISSVATSMGNVGPGLGEIGPTKDFTVLERPARGVLMVVMLVGRLEIFPVLLGLVPVFRFIGRQLPPRVASRLGRLGSG